MSKSLKALIFDVDGTLAETEHSCHRVSFNLAFAEAGLDWHWDENIYGPMLAITNGKARIRQYATEVKQMAFDSPAALKQFVNEVHAIKTRHSVRMLADGLISLRPGVARLLTEARQQGLRLALATTTTKVNALALLEATLPPGGVNWFEVMATGEMFENRKPAPDVYRYVMEQLGLTAGQCLAFEDSWPGLTSARRANLRTVVTVAHYTRNDDLSGATLLLNHLGEPDKPFTVLAGNAHGKTYFDVALARRLVDAA